MKKEVVIVIFFGLIVGLTVTFFAYRLRKDKLTATNTDVGKKIELDSSLLGEEKNDEVKPVTITSPENGAVVSEKNLIVKGQVPPNSTAVLFVNDTDQLQTASASGEVSFEITLTSGSNIVELFSIDASGQTYSQQIIIIYSNQSLEEVLVSDQQLEEENKTK